MINSDQSDNNLESTYFKDFDKQTAYPIDMYKNTGLNFNLLIKLEESKHLVVDILPDSSYIVNKNSDDGKRYIKVTDIFSNRNVIIDLSDKDFKTFDEYIDEDKDLKKVVLHLYDSKDKIVHQPIIFYSGNEIYIKPIDMYTLSLYAPSVIYSQIISATTNKLFSNQTKIRKKPHTK